MDRPGSGLRRLTGLLLLLNAGLLAGGLALTYWPSRPNTALEFNAEKVKLLELPPAQGQPPSIPEAPVSARDAAAPASGSARSCLSWPGLDADGLAAVEAHLKKAGVAAEGYRFQLAKRLGWWVYLPPFEDAEALRLALEDARQKGITDFAQVRGGRLANALSLGAFPSLEKARAHAAAVTAKGLRGVRYGPRPEAGEVRLVFSGGEAGKPPDTLAGAWPAGLKPEACEAGD